MHIEIFHGVYHTSPTANQNLWYWRAVAKNGRIIADGGEGFANKKNARKSVMRLVSHILTGGASTIKVLS